MATLGSSGRSLRSVLAGVPLGAWGSAVVFDVVSRSADHPEAYARGSFWLHWAGIAAAIVVVVLALVERQSRREIAITAVAIAGLVVSAFVRNDGLWDPVAPGLIALSGIAGVAYAAAVWLDVTRAR
jgi:CHASE2 domain-containing sensor protein